MSLAGIAVDASTRSPIVLLRDLAGLRQVPIWIDDSQARNILAGLKGDKQKRLLTHDLMFCIVKAGNLILDRVIIHSLKNAEFQAVLKLKASKYNNDSNPQVEGSLIEIEASPGDAIALAIRAKTSIWIPEEIIAEASIPVDRNADNQNQNDFRRFLEQVSPAELVRQLKEHNPEEDEYFDSTNSGIN